MEGEGTIEIFLEEYTAQMNCLVTEGFCESPLVDGQSTWSSITYKVADLDVAFEISLDARDFIVSTYITLFTEAKRPGVFYVSQGRVIRLFLGEILKQLGTQIPSVQEELKQWKADTGKHFKRIDRSLRALKMPDTKAVRELFRTDAQWVAQFLRQYREEIIRYARNYWGL